VSDAYDDAVRLLARRALSRQELADRLGGRGHAPDAVDEALDRLAAARAVDDAALARQHVASRALARGRGRERTIAELLARGVAQSVAETAWRESEEDGTIEAATLLDRAVLRRLGPPPGRANRARLARVYNALLSEGFERDPIEAALAPYGLERTDG
jgi:regulatory protein